MTPRLKRLAIVDEGRRVNYFFACLKCGTSFSACSRQCQFPFSQPHKSNLRWSIAPFIVPRNEKSRYYIHYEPCLTNTCLSLNTIFFFVSPSPKYSMSHFSIYLPFAYYKNDPFNLRAGLEGQLKYQMEHLNRQKYWMFGEGHRLCVYSMCSRVRSSSASENRKPVLCIFPCGATFRANAPVEVIASKSYIEGRGTDTTKTRGIIHNKWCS